MTEPLADRFVLGFGLPVSGVWATPDTVDVIARRAEELGYGSLWTYSRLLAPAGTDWGPQYRSVLDPVVALAYAAAVTSNARLGTAVINAPFLPPALLAKQLASLDVLAGGRLDVGLGLGWAREEFTAVGAPYERRGAQLEEAVAALRALWGPDPVEFSGAYARIPTSRFDPKPVQRPHPPLLLGGTAGPALARAGRIADGWISSSRFDLRQIETAVSTVRAAARQADRDDTALRLVVRGVVHLGEEVRERDGARRLLTGSADAVRDDLARLRELGATEVFLDLNFVPRVGSPDADAAGALDHAHEVLETFAPAAHPLGR
ncbi:MAG: TIGR03619 family F420-dependent LLM class oxidoreductase [Kineosporiaceae bacterium]